ncbi:hypothetical protein K2173_022909 [Erythroxylum novogranatense]|uniref:EF-hand domain-containing protein n=1 Tax=Erythroxylum novogranatense TaxID=1862640 RepID=A0AAV8T994_9ROSI|nr:hypothetical protein K2173_022909 [Erythroxylum novogranatense]
MALEILSDVSPLNNTDLYRIFHVLDKNRDGLLSLEELNWLLESIGIIFSLKDLESSVGKSVLSLDDFVAFYESITKKDDRDDRNVRNAGEGSKNVEDSYLAMAFDVFDLNRDGVISSQELQSTLLRLGLWDENSGKDCRSMLGFYDTNSDGVLDFEEFKNMMLQS